MPARNDKARGPSQRQLRIGELVRHALVDIFRDTEIRDEALADLCLTVSEVRVSPDGRNATAFVMPLGSGVLPGAIAGAGGGAGVITALNANTRFIRGELARAVELKFTPALKFAIDGSFDESQRIDQVLRSPAVARDLAKR